MSASAEETFDHLINVWIINHGCPIRFQSDNGKAFVGDLTRELMKRSQVAQAHSTSYRPQKNSLVERQNCTLVSMLWVYCLRYMNDCDKQVMGAYNSTEHSTTGISPHMMLTGHKPSLRLTFLYPENLFARCDKEATRIELSVPKEHAAGTNRGEGETR